MFVIPERAHLQCPGADRFHTSPQFPGHLHPVQADFQELSGGPQLEGASGTKMSDARPPYVPYLAHAKVLGHICILPRILVPFHIESQRLEEEVESGGIHGIIAVAPVEWADREDVVVIALEVVAQDFFFVVSVVV